MKNILITGATDGIGKLSAIRLAKAGHAVYLHGRSEAKVKACVSEIRADTNNENVCGFVADFSDLNAVRQLTQELKEQVPQIDILINNAGVFKSPDFYNQDGLDLRFVVNYLAPYLLTRELLPLLEKGGESRIINLSSAAQSDISYEAMLGKEQISLNASYAQSKLALSMWTFHLAKQLKSVSVIALNPGSLLNTKMANEAYGQHWSPAGKGADIILELALDRAHKGITGQYYDNDKGNFATAHQQAYNTKAIERLIKFTNEVLG